MTHTKSGTKLILGLTLAITLPGCAPEVGSDAWCKSMAEKSKADWTVNEATDFATNCVFKTYDN